jgi:hypothetical protein
MPLLKKSIRNGDVFVAYFLQTQLLPQLKPRTFVPLVYRQITGRRISPDSVVEYGLIERMREKRRSFLRAL